MRVTTCVTMDECSSTLALFILAHHPPRSSPQTSSTSMRHSKPRREPQVADQQCPFCGGLYTRSGIGRHRAACERRARTERGLEEYRARLDSEIHTGAYFHGIMELICTDRRVLYPFQSVRSLSRPCATPDIRATRFP